MSIKAESLEQHATAIKGFETALGDDRFQISFIQGSKRAQSFQNG
jgi:hypothetical protein